MVWKYVDCSLETWQKLFLIFSLCLVLLLMFDELVKRSLDVYAYRKP